MNYKPTFTFPRGEILTNTQVFATKGEAEASAFARFHLLDMPTDYGTRETMDPVNYTHENGRDISI